MTARLSGSRRSPGGPAPVDDLRIDPDGDGCRLALRVKPGARRSRIAGIYGERLRVEVAAPPERGKANDALCALLAEALGVSRAEVELKTGHGSQDKVVRLRGLSPAEARRRLEADRGKADPEASTRSEE